MMWWAVERRKDVISGDAKQEEVMKRAESRVPAILERRTMAHSRPIRRRVFQEGLSKKGITVVMVFSVKS